MVDNDGNCEFFFIDPKSFCMSRFTTVHEELHHLMLFAILVAKFQYNNGMRFSMRKSGYLSFFVHACMHVGTICQIFSKKKKFENLESKNDKEAASQGFPN